MLKFILMVVVLFTLSGVLLARPEPAPASEFPQRAILPLVARDAESAAPLATATRRPPPPPGPGYCGPSLTGSPSPPNAIFGLLTLGSVQAPAETLVTLTFDGQPGVSEYTVAAGGYRVFYAAGGQGHEPRCINEVGSELGLLINGVPINVGVKVGDEAARPALRFDVSVN
ncbi:MAG: hypothetical protein ABI939_05105 [Anaerolineaceae bacterium]